MMKMKNREYLTIEEMIRMKENDEIEEYLKNFIPCKSKCPHPSLQHLDKKRSCFYCCSCIRKAFDEIKILKRSYKIGKRKIRKENLNVDSK